MVLPTHEPSATPTNDNPAAQAPVPHPDPAPEHIGLRFCAQDGSELYFKLKPNTKLSKAMDAFSARMERDRKSLRFLFEGERVLDDSTPASLDMQDGDVVDVHTEQIGGTATEPNADQNAQWVTLSLQDQFGNRVYFKLRASTMLGKVMDSYCAQRGFPRTALLCLFRGRMIYEHQTPGFLEMRDGNIAEVYWC